MASDNDDDKDDNDDDDDDDDDANRKDVETVEIGTGKTLTMLSRLVNLNSKEERNSLVAMTSKIETIRVLNKKQSHINNSFKL